MKWKLAACRINKGLKQKDVAELMHSDRIHFKINNNIFHGSFLLSLFGYSSYLKLYQCFDDVSITRHYLDSNVNTVRNGKP